MQRFINNWSATLLAGAAPASETLSVEPALAAALGDLGDGDYYLLTLAAWDATGSEDAWEIVKVTSIDGGALSVQRGQEGTDQAAWDVGTTVSARLSAGSLEALLAAHSALLDAVAAREFVLQPGANVAIDRSNPAAPVISAAGGGGAGGGDGLTKENFIDLLSDGYLGFMGGATDLSFKRHGVGYWGLFRGAPLIAGESAYIETGGGYARAVGAGSRLTRTLPTDDAPSYLALEPGGPESYCEVGLVYAGQLQFDAEAILDQSVATFYFVALGTAPGGADETRIEAALRVGAYQVSIYAEPGINSGNIVVSLFGHPASSANPPQTINTDVAFVWAESASHGLPYLSATIRWTGPDEYEFEVTYGTGSADEQLVLLTGLSHETVTFGSGTARLLQPYAYLNISQVPEASGQRLAFDRLDFRISLRNPD